MELKFNPKQAIILPELLKNEYDEILLDGGSRCFYPGQLIKTKYGNKPISQLEPGNQILTLNEKTNKKEYKPLLKKHIFRNNKKDIIRIKLKNGVEIKGTFDHEIYFNNKWITLGEIKRRFYDNLENDSRI
jgi:intein/homing endonuclease